jgi:hypothetical protein
MQHVWIHDYHAVRVGYVVMSRKPYLVAHGGVEPHFLLFLPIGTARGDYLVRYHVP